MFFNKNTYKKTCRNLAEQGIGIDVFLHFSVEFNSAYNKWRDKTALSESEQSLRIKSDWTSLVMDLADVCEEKINEGYFLGNLHFPLQCSDGEGWTVAHELAQRGTLPSEFFGEIDYGGSVLSLTSKNGIAVSDILTEKNCLTKDHLSAEVLIDKFEEKPCRNRHYLATNESAKYKIKSTFAHVLAMEGKLPESMMTHDILSLTDGEGVSVREVIRQSYVSYLDICVRDGRWDEIIQKMNEIDPYEDYYSMERAQISREKNAGDRSDMFQKLVVNNKNISRKEEIMEGTVTILAGLLKRGREIKNLDGILSYSPSQCRCFQGIKTRGETVIPPENRPTVAHHLAEQGLLPKDRQTGHILGMHGGDIPSVASVLAGNDNLTKEDLFKKTYIKRGKDLYTCTPETYQQIPDHARGTREYMETSIAHILAAEGKLPEKLITEDILGLRDGDGIPLQKVLQDKGMYPQSVPEAFNFLAEGKKTGEIYMRSNLQGDMAKSMIKMAKDKFKELASKKWESHWIKQQMKDVDFDRGIDMSMW